MTMTEAPAEVESAAGHTDAGPGDGAPTAGGGTTKGKKAKKAKKERQGRSNLVPALVLAAGIAAGGYFMGGASSADPTADPPPEGPTAAEPGDVFALEALTVNLDNGRFLRVGVALLMSAEFHGVGGDAHGNEAPSFRAEDSTRLRDQLIAMFSGRELSTLTGPGALDATKAELLERANAVLGDQALEVYVTEFVTQ